MSNPGSNLLNRALRLIAPSSFYYYQFSSRSVQSNGLDLTTYNPPIILQGSVQAVPRNLYEIYGLDLQKNYITVYVAQSVLDIERDVSGDQVVYGGNTYQCLSETNWFPMDGWVGVLCCQVVNTPVVIGISISPIPEEITTEDGNPITNELGNILITGNVDVLTGNPIIFIINFNYPVMITGTPFLTLQAIGGAVLGNAIYISGTTTNSLTFSYSVQSQDSAPYGLITSSPVNGIITDMTGSIPANASFIVPDLSGVLVNV